MNTDTMQYAPFIFPDLSYSTWAIADLGKLAARDFPDTSEKNALLNPDLCAAWVNLIAASAGVDYTWGGHFEDRQHLWRGYYTDAEAVTHLGVDYNVPSGTRVATPRDGIVVHSWADTSIHNGWGGRLIILLSEPWQGAQYLIFGHLAHAALPQVGTHFNAGDIIGVTGTADENGGWFPHLHVQCASSEFYSRHMDDLRLLDGYVTSIGKPYDEAPDPSFLVGCYVEKSPI